uniref:(California timema) hypothetical protein n=1 Tax=Timema californicum TaxID=61474 RepID=A0A7R9J1D1_TIMCA|nr:unnamed protein product [Timema californicum]
MSRYLNKGCNADPLFNFEYRGPVTMKGKSEPMDVWFLTRSTTRGSYTIDKTPWTATKDKCNFHRLRTTCQYHVPWLQTYSPPNLHHLQKCIHTYPILPGDKRRVWIFRAQHTHHWSPSTLDDKNKIEAAKCYVIRLAFPEWRALRRR